MAWTCHKCSIQPTKKTWHRRQKVILSGRAKKGVCGPCSQCDPAGIKALVVGVGAWPQKPATLFFVKICYVVTVLGMT